MSEDKLAESILTQKERGPHSILVVFSDEDFATMSKEYIDSRKQKKMTKAEWVCRE